MNKEQAIENLKLIRLNAGMTGAESFKEALDLAIVSLSQPSLPSNIDEAAAEWMAEREKLIREKYYPFVFNAKDIFDAFKSGAEWMAGKYEKIEGELVDWYSTSDGKDYCCGVKTIDSFEAPEGFYIRKKQ